MTPFTDKPDVVGMWPGYNVPVIMARDEGRTIESFKWGFMVPMKDGKPVKEFFTDQQIFAFAALYQERDGIGYCSMLTTTPNELVEPYHNRMPVILLPEYEEEWLNPENTDAEALKELCLPYPAERMRVS